MIKIIQGDCIEKMKDIPDNSKVLGSPAKIIENGKK